MFILFTLTHCIHPCSILVSSISLAHFFSLLYFFFLIFSLFLSSAFLFFGVFSCFSFFLHSHTLRIFISSYLQLKQKRKTRNRKKINKKNIHSRYSFVYKVKGEGEGLIKKRVNTNAVFSFDGVRNNFLLEFYSA